MAIVKDFNNYYSYMNEKILDNYISNLVGIFSYISYTRRYF